MRVIAGKFKSLKLNSFESEEIRPTLDKVKEAVFSKIQFDIKNSNFLDLFGGTGGIGIEALSRGANVFVADKSAKSCSIIKDNYKRVNSIPNLLNMDYVSALNFYKRNNIKFDFCYIDPPFNTDFGSKAIDLIIDLDLLNDGGLIIFEHLKENPFSFSNEHYELIDTKNYGTISIEYIKKF